METTLDDYEHSKQLADWVFGRLHAYVDMLSQKSAPFAAFLNGSGEGKLHLSEINQVEGMLFRSARLLTGSVVLAELILRRPAPGANWNIVGFGYQRGEQRPFLVGLLPGNGYSYRVYPDGKRESVAA